MNIYIERTVFIATVVILFFAFCKVLKAETYNTMHLDCGTLHGKGAIGIWFNDEYYLIPIACE